MTAENEAINLHETDKATVITCIGAVIWSLLKFFFDNSRILHCD